MEVYEWELIICCRDIIVLVCHVILQDTSSKGRVKRDYFSYHSNSCKEENTLHQKHESFTFKLALIKLN